MATTSEWFRSAPMEYVSLVMQEHCAHRCMTKVGTLGIVQFVDMNSKQTAFQRRFVAEVKRCDELNRKLVYFNQMLEKYDLEAQPGPPIDQFLEKLEARNLDASRGMDVLPTSILDELEVLLEEKESELRELADFRTNLHAEYNAQVGLRNVLEHSRQLQQGGDGGLSSDVTRSARSASSVASPDTVELGIADAGGIAQRVDNSLRFRFLTGVVSKEERVRFERMIFRSTRGNCLMRFTEIEEPLEDITTGGEIKQEVFIIFFQASYVENKIRRICDAFNAKLYEIPDMDNVSASEAKLTQVYSEIADRERVLRKNKTDVITLLSEVARWVQVWKWTIAREKSVYHTMNYFAADVKGVLRAEGWVIASAKSELQTAIYDVHSSMSGGGGALPSSITTISEAEWPGMPPTFFETNKFTDIFQVFVDTYGVPRYREANPALFTSITFPFFFGVMFGDIGHGILLSIFAAWLCWKEDEIASKPMGEVMEGLHAGRYLLLLMGFFSTYCGFLYNDWFAIGLRLFEPTWTIPVTETVETVGYNRTVPFRVYPAGMDPTWHRAENGLLFFNSVKMKMAIVFGVTQMTLGLVLKLMNAIYYKKRLDVYFEAIPQIIFMLSLFGYMCFVIIYKWTVDWVNDCERSNCNPPTLITTLINIALAPGTVEQDQLLYEGQALVQTILLLLAVLSLPLMFFPKPYITIKRMKKSRIGTRRESLEGLILQESNGSLHVDEAADVHALESHRSEEHHSPSDLWIHQAIETIEFALGCISNTASYLRLWALSLAHSQLGFVFLSKALLGMLTMEGATGVLFTFAGYAVFAGATFAVLLCMDNLECFLHALRLHWVEFQNKFYGADGKAFMPIHFQATLKQGL